MTLTKLLIYVAIAAILLTLAVGFGFKKHKSWFMTFLQNYCGALFLFSGWVKAVDPMGTAFKMADYFAGFETTFADTWFSFITPIFPLLSSYKVSFAVFMIVLELVLGLLLITGDKSKFTRWAFFIVVVFFTMLTGYTYLTGYVPGDVNFFQFSQWAGFKESNMQVTDCGCFGDFLKLKPKVSFMKDVALLFPAIYFLFRHKDMHELFTPMVRRTLAILIGVGTFIYCLSNFVWDIPHADFRPFRKGVNIAAQKEAELNALAAVPILAYEMKNRESGEVSSLPYNEYLKRFQEFPKEQFELNQVLGEVTVPQTKIAEFDVTSIDYRERTGELLSDEKPSFMLVSYEMPSKGVPAKREVRDSIFVQDTVMISQDSFQIVQKLQDVMIRDEQYVKFDWDKKFLSNYKDVISPFAQQVDADGFDIYSIVGGADQNMVDQLAEDADLNIDFYTADAILLKTIVRSNPGVVLLHNGQILDKWHISKLPSYEEIKAEHNLK